MAVIVAGVAVFVAGVAEVVACVAVIVAALACSAAFVASTVPVDGRHRTLAVDESHACMFTRDAGSVHILPGARQA